MIERVPFGRTDFTVPAFGFGAAGLPADDDTSAFKVMAHAVEKGINFFDTADLYGIGLNESQIGRFLKTMPSGSVIIGTKYGSMPKGEDGLPGVNNKPEHIQAACEASLKRLGVEVIDVYYMHRRDPDVPVEESVGAMARLIEQGKVRALGLSEVSAATLRAAHAVHPIAAVESEYSLWWRGVEDEVLPACRELGVTMVPFSPLGRSFLTGTLSASSTGSDLRSTLPRFQAEALAKNQLLVDQLALFAQGRGFTTAQVALAWLLGQNDATTSVVPIPGTKRTEYIDQNLGALGVKLTPDELDELATIFAPEAITGDRYSEVEAARAGL